MISKLSKLCSFGKKGNKTSKHKSVGSSSSSVTTTNSHHGSSPSKPLYLSNPHVNNMLVRGNFKTIVELPKYVDLNEWLAFNSKLSKMGGFFFTCTKKISCLLILNSL